ncbi:MAG: hypothetical protein R2874_10740 [Desulfobacterales bacterium]
MISTGLAEYKADLADIKDVQRVHFCAPDEKTVMTESHFTAPAAPKPLRTR